jgi:hypothetical protein
MCGESLAQQGDLFPECNQEPDRKPAKPTDTDSASLF